MSLPDNFAILAMPIYWALAILPHGMFNPAFTSDMQLSHHRLWNSHCIWRKSAKVGQQEPTIHEPQGESQSQIDPGTVCVIRTGRECFCKRIRECTIILCRDSHRQISRSRVWCSWQVCSYFLGYSCSSYCLVPSRLRSGSQLCAKLYLGVQSMAMSQDLPCCSQGARILIVSYHVWGLWSGSLWWCF